MKFFNLIQAWVCLLSSFVLFNGNSYSQCSNGTPASNISYDTVFHGGGNNTYDINFPQFDTNRVYLSFPQFTPSKGTLIGVDFKTIITVKNSYKVENQDNLPSLSKVKIIRTDIINSNALTAPLENIQGKTIALNSLGSSDGVSGSGLDYKEDGPIYSYKNAVISNSITSNLAGFMGNGQVVFNYETHTDLFSSGSNNVFTSTTEDSIYVQLTYRYCTTSLLPADISNFSAVKAGSSDIQLSWTVPNDNIANKYEMQKSIDGRNYFSFLDIVAKSAASNNYQVKYTSTKDDKNKVFFRIRQIEADGGIKYSVIKTVTLDYVSTTMKVYPTVTKSEVNIYFQYAPKANYLVSVLNLSGQVMQQAVFPGTTLIKILLKPTLKSGLYILCVTNKQTLERQQSKLVIE